MRVGHDRSRATKRDDLEHDIHTPPGSTGGCDLAGARPRDAPALCAWLRDHLALEVPDRALIEGHDAPFDYLCHAFFDGGDDGRGSGPGVRAGVAGSDAVVWANRGGGKTFLAAVATLLDLVHKPGIAVRILGGSLDQSKRLYAHLRALFEGSDLMGMVDGKITQKGLKLRNGSEAQVLAQSQTAVRGTRVQKIRCDEVELFDPEVWEAAQLATMGKWCGEGDERVWVPGTIECLSTMHVPYGLMYRIVGEAQRKRDEETERRSGGGAEAGGPSRSASAAPVSVSSSSGTGEGPTRTLFKWGVIDVLEKCPPSRDCSVCPLEGACGGRAKRSGDPVGVGGHLTVADVVQLRRRVGEGTWQAEMLCTRPRRDDCVLPEFDRGRHVIDRFDAPAHGVWIGGMDFGIRAPTVVLWAHADGSGVVRVLGERVVSGEVIASHVAAIRAGGSGAGAPFPVPAWIGVDPAGRQRSEQTGVSAIEVMKRSGLAVRDRRLGLAAGLDLIRARLAPASGGPTLFVHVSCEKLIESLERYRYPADQPESTTPVKDGSDHAVDALRYMIQNLDAGYRSASGRYV